MQMRSCGVACRTDKPYFLAPADIFASALQTAFQMGIRRFQALAVIYNYNVSICTLPTGKRGFSRCRSNYGSSFGYCQIYAFMMAVPAAYFSKG